MNVLPLLIGLNLKIIQSTQDVMPIPLNSDIFQLEELSFWITPAITPLIPVILPFRYKCKDVAKDISNPPANASNSSVGSARILQEIIVFAKIRFFFSIMIF